MKVKLLTILLIAMCQSLALAQTQAIVANPDNRSPIDASLLKLMLTGKERYWQDGAEVAIAILKADESVEDALNAHCGMSASKFKNHWQRIAFSGRGKMPKQFATMEELVAYVQANKGAIGIVADSSKTNTLRRID